MAKPPKAPLTDQQKQRNARRYASIAAAATLVGAGYLLWTWYRPQQVALPQPKLGQSEPIFNEALQPKEVKSVPSGDLEITPKDLDMGTVTLRAQRATRSFTIKAKNAPATITKVELPFAQDTGLKIDSSLCTSGPLDAEASCPITVVFDPVQAGSIRSMIRISATFQLANGGGRSMTAQVPIDANAENPAPVVPPPSVASAQSQIENSPYSVDDLAYLQRRRRPGLLDMQFDQAAYGYMGPQDPSQDNWRSIGYGPNMSSYPVDMTRVVTMDKPIPAVIKLPIDSRHPSRAVATVERDIYGGDGRTVLIERGSTLIGSASSVGNPAEEKMGISWERLMRPDGSAWTLSATSGDAMGRSGVIGFNDDRWFERFGVTLAASAMVAGIDIGLNASQSTSTNGLTSTSTTTPAYVAAQQFNGDFRSVFSQFAKEQMSIQPIRTIPVGTRITVFPTTDLWLRPVTPNSDMRAEYARKATQSADFQAAQMRAAAAQKAASPTGAQQAQQPAATGQTQIPPPSSIGTADRLTTLGQQGGLTGLTPVTAPPTGDSQPTAAAGQASFASQPSAVETYGKNNPNPVTAPQPSLSAPGVYPNQTTYATPAGAVTVPTQQSTGWIR